MPPSSNNHDRVWSQGGGAGEPELPASGEARQQVERILASPEFAVPDRARKVLKYLVDETLAGRADRIKAYSIAVEVFGRDESFDAQNDPVVRIEAGRIRRALERYYLVAGQSDPIFVTIPKGSYVPLFERRTATEFNDNAAAADAPVPLAVDRKWRSSGTDLFGIALVGIAILVLLLATPNYRSNKTNSYVPKVAVAPFSNLEDDSSSKDFAFGLTSEIVNQLARFKDIIVTTKDPQAATDLPGSSDQYDLTGSVRASKDRIRVTVQLKDGDSKKILWTEAYEDDLRVGDMLGMQKDVAQKVAIAIGQPRGVVFRVDTSLIEQYPPDDFGAYSCTLDYFAYRAALQPQQHANVRACLEDVVARHPRYATAWALLSSAYLDEDRFEYNPRAGAEPAVRRSLEAAQRAVSLDPQNIRALQALMLAQFFNRDVATAVVTGERALALNPNDMELLGEFGVRTALSGNWAEGSAMIERALAHTSSNTNYYYTVLAVAAYMQRDFVRATDIIRQASIESNGLYCLVAAAIYGQRGMQAEAEAAKTAYFATRTHYLENLDEEFAKRNFRDSDKAFFAEGLRKAGLPVPASH